ncbi:MAG: 50S ribosomal protein L28 [Chloroflexi bacterium]|nr:50S ribosomal protein L28 [Chloroflexota bacterium]
MAKCELCGKALTFGRSVSHSKRHTSRQWLPNIHSSRLLIEGRLRKLKVCTRCLRTHRKQEV